MKFRILALLTFLVAAAMVSAQDRKQMQTANMSRAMEAYENSDIEEMHKYLSYEEQNDPRNGYAYSWHALVYYSNGEYGNALKSSDMALKYLPNKDKEYISFTYSTRSDIYVAMGETDNALKAITQAIKIKNDQTRLYQQRAEIYFDNNQYDLADKDYRQMLKIDDNNYMALMGLGRNEKERGNCEKAMEYFNKVILLYGKDYSSGYSFRAECYLKMGAFNLAADDVVSALSVDYDRKAYYLMYQIADSSYHDMAARLRIQMNKYPNTTIWTNYLGHISASTKQYTKALEYYQKAYQTDPQAYTASYVANTYNELGQYHLALHYVNKAIAEDTAEASYRNTRITTNYNLDNKTELFNDLDFSISQYPNYYYGYNHRGWYKALYGDLDGAAEDYTSSIVLNENADTYLHRGRIQRAQGQNASARRDLQKSIQLDTAGGDRPSTTSMYAYYHLGNRAMAQKIFDSLMNADAITLYDAACIQSLMGNTAQAISYLRKDFEQGEYQFNHIRRDSDLDNIRNEQEFKDLVASYERQWRASLETPADATSTGNQRIVEVPFERTGGVTSVKCTINGLPLHFIFDTGAADVSLSSVEAAFMFKNGYLSAKDVVGRRNYLTASGDVVEGTVITLREINFGGLTLTNVRASVTKGQSAPLLLGQTVLSRLGKIEIDNTRNVLKITHQE